ncbi:hypothetical protein EZV62_009487 [Acer yangbiense]|uniref:PGG domain-containing protein n=1 Tax=Acer yangbiense TaxID=1000413 RepID=A0A5C7HZ74_9ROSI|nr:hypothetical protein EZV62_009487 [Acer yangbiense]
MANINDNHVDDDRSNIISGIGCAWQDNKGHEAGKAILASNHFHLPYNLFLILNTLAFSMSTQIILMLVYHKKLYFEVVVATLAMVATYGMAVWSLSPDEEGLTGDARNVILVVMTSLIAAMTFQAEVNPPGGLWQEDRDRHMAGRAIYASQQRACYVFLISNTVALSTCILVIVSLAHKFPFHFEIGVATGAMLVTYASAIFVVTPEESIRFRYILIAAAVPFLVRGLIQLYNWFRNPKVSDCINDN